MKKFNELLSNIKAIEESIKIDEILSASDPTSKWISDFVHSDNPKFEDKSKKERIQMALGAAYAAKRTSNNEELNLEIVDIIAEQLDLEIIEQKSDLEYAEDVRIEALKLKENNNLDGFHILMAIHHVHLSEHFIENQKTNLAKKHDLLAMEHLSELSDKYSSELIENLLTDAVASATADYGVDVKMLPDGPVKNKTWPHPKGKAAKGTSYDAVIDKYRTAKPKATGEINPKRRKEVEQEINRKTIFGEEIETEEFEQIDELSKKTLRSYMAKAVGSKTAHDYAAGLAAAYDLDDVKNKHLQKSKKRTDGLVKAIIKTTKEEVEQIDELSPELMRRAADKYQDKINRSKHPAETDKLLDKQARMSGQARRNELGKRYKDGGLAARKEEVEQIDELKQETMKTYMRAAKKDINKNLRGGDPEPGSKRAAKVEKRVAGYRKAWEKTESQNEEVVAEAINPDNPKDYDKPTWMRRGQSRFALVAHGLDAEKKAKEPLTIKDVRDRDTESPTTPEGLAKKAKKLGINEGMTPAVSASIGGSMGSSGRAYAKTKLLAAKARSIKEEVKQVDEVSAKWVRQNVPYYPDRAINAVHIAQRPYRGKYDTDAEAKEADRIIRVRTKGYERYAKKNSKENPPPKVTPSDNPGYDRGNRPKSGFGSGREDDTYGT